MLNRWRSLPPIGAVISASVRVPMLLVTVLSLLVGFTVAAHAQAPSSLGKQELVGVLGSSQTADSAAGGIATDVAITGYGDGSGYHLEVGRESSGFSWREIAVLQPGGIDASSWTGYQCMSGDGRFAAVAILPTLGGGYRAGA